MELKFIATLDDVVAFSLYIFKKHQMPRMPFQVAFATMLLTIGSSTFWLSLLKDGDLLFAAVGLLLAGSSTFPVWYPKLIASRIRNYLRKVGTQENLVPTQLIVSDESLVQISEAGRNEAKWGEMFGLEEIEGYTFIRITSLSAVIIPQASCPSDDDYFRVRDFARHHIGEPTRLR